MYRRILVPLDCLPLSEAILPHVQALAKAMGSEMILLYVQPSPAPEFSSPPRPFTKNIIHDQKRTATRYLKAQCAQLEKEGAHVTYLIRDGAVAETIIEVAEFMHAEMIAMSTQGPSGAQLLLLGSVTYQVVRHSPLPVMVIRSRV